MNIVIILSYHEILIIIIIIISNHILKNIFSFKSFHFISYQVLGGGNVVETFQCTGTVQVSISILLVLTFRVQQCTHPQSST